MNKKQLLYDKQVQIANRASDIKRLEKEIQKLESTLSTYTIHFNKRPELFYNKNNTHVKHSIYQKKVLINKLKKLSES